MPEPPEPPRPLRFGRYDYASFLTYIAYAAGSVAAPVCLVHLARDLGFRLDAGGMSAGGALHLGRTAAIVAAMLACGFLAGRWGKRATLGVSVVLMGLGVGVCAVAPTYGIVFLAILVAGLGEGVVEGLATPFVQDLHPDEPGRYVNFTHAFWSIGVLVTVLAAGALLSVGVSWRLVIGAVGVVSAAPALMLLGPAKGHREAVDPLDGRAVLAHTRQLLRRPRFWALFAAMFVAGGGEFCLTFWCASFLQINLAASAWVGGLGTACFAGGMALGRLAGGWWVPEHKLRAFILISAAAGVALTLLLPTVRHLGLFLTLLFLVGIATAPYWPSVQSYSVPRLPGADMTLLMILLACAGIPGCGFATWLMGVIGDRAGLGVAFYLVPACYLILFLLIAVESATPLREKRA